MGSRGASSQSAAGSTKGPSDMALVKAWDARDDELRARLRAAKDDPVVTADLTAERLRHHQKRPTVVWTKAIEVRYYTRALKRAREDLAEASEGATRDMYARNVKHIEMMLDRARSRKK